MTFFAFSLYFRLLPTFYSTFCSIQLQHFGVFNCQFSVPSNISKKNSFLTLPKRWRYASNLFLQNIHYKKCFFFSSKRRRYRHKKALVLSNFSKSVCAYNFSCATFYKDSSEFGMTCMKYVQKPFCKKHLYALQVFLCALVSRPVCARTRAQPRGNIDHTR